MLFGSARTPAVSVVMPVFNRRDRVARAVESVLAQDFADFELVIVDDASTDNTVEVIQSFSDPRIVLLRQPENRLAGAARNRGVREASCELIAFIDSDDEFLSHKLGFVVEYFRRHPDVDALIDSFELVYPPRMRKRPTLRLNLPLSDSEAILEGVYARRISKATPALTARRPALLAAGLFDETLRRRQDFDLVVRLLHSCRGATTDRVLWRKHWTEGAITSQLHTFMPAILEMCRRNPEYLTTPKYRIGVARDLAHHVLRLSGKREFTLLGNDLGRFAEAHGAVLAARLVAQGMVETAKRSLTGTH
jgi:glycosyltransferase involved in cell wall biosynthesis